MNPKHLSPRGNHFRRVDGEHLPESRGHSFVGREAELRKLLHGHQTSRQLHRHVFLLTGESGIGKTCLLDEFRRQVGEDSETLVMQARCCPGQPGPFHPIDQWAKPLTSYLEALSRQDLVELLPPHSHLLTNFFPSFEHLVSKQADGGDLPNHYKKELRWEAFHALRELFARLATRTRLVMLVDDLQWADADSFTLLQSVLRYSDRPTVLFVGCCRVKDIDESDDLKTFVASVEGIHQLFVGPLNEDESNRLSLNLIEVNDHTDEESSTQSAQGLARCIATNSQGNPYLLRELAREPLRNDTWNGNGHNLTVDRMLWSRIQRLNEQARSLIYMLCVAEQPLHEEHALAASQVDSGSSTLQLLRRKSLICPIGSEQSALIDVYDDRIRQSVLSRIGADVRWQCNHRLAVTGETTGEGKPDFLATRFQVADQPEKAAEYFEIAANHAADRMAFHRAAKFYAATLDQNVSSSKKRNDNRMSLADALSNASQSTEAAKEYLRLADALRGSESIAMQQHAFTQYLLSGQLHEGVSVLKDVLGRLGLKMPRTFGGTAFRILLTRFQIWLRGTNFQVIPAGKIPTDDLLRVDVLWCVAICLRRTDLIRGVDFAVRSCLEAIRLGEPGRIARNLALEGVHRLVPGERSSRRAAELIDMAKTLSTESDSPLVCTQVTMCEGIASALLGQWERSFVYSERAEVGFKSDEVGEITTSRFWQMLSLIWLGRFAELQKRCVGFVESASERGDVYELVNLGTLTLAIARLAQDRPREAWDEVHSAMNRWTQEGFHIQHHLDWDAKVSILLYEGNHREASVMLNKCWSQHTRSSLWRAHLVRSNMQHLRVRVALSAIKAGDDQTNAIRTAQKGIDALNKEALPWTTALAKASHASLEQWRGNQESAKSKFDQAAKEFDALDMDLLATISRRRVGKLLGGDRGKHLVDDADEWMRGQQIVAPARMAEFWVP